MALNKIEQNNKVKPEQAHSQIQSSVLMSYNGPGSIYESQFYLGKNTSLNSVIILGLDYWATKNIMKKVREPQLEKMLKVKYFYSPIPAMKNAEPEIPIARFPKWYYCPECKRLGKIGAPFKVEREQVVCSKCKESNSNKRCLPAPLVVTCENNEGESSYPLGHLDDFPWIEWAHSNENGEVQICSHPVLKLESDKGSYSLSALKVKCMGKECIEANRPGRRLDGVLEEDALKGLIDCSGYRPWLLDRENGCENKPRAVMRNATNLYFPVRVSALSIPPYASFLYRTLKEWDDSILEYWQDMPLERVIKTIKDKLPSLEVYSSGEIKSALLKITSNKEDTPRENRSSQTQREDEREAIIKGYSEQDDIRSEFYAEPVNVKLLGSMSEYFSQVVKVHKLKEVLALRGFHRLVPLSGGDPLTVPVVPLAKEKIDWLPALEMKGEGIYLELNPQRINSWSSLPAVSKRMEIINRNYRTYLKTINSEASSFTPTAGLVLTHTLAHLLLKELSLSAGYGIASMRERMYVSTDAHFYGFLIYTATQSLSGTLGGLVREGDPARLEKIIIQALENAKWCSSDPLCKESTGQGPNSLNLAACHNCALVPETSCEHYNCYLDRVLLVGEEEGYFN